MTRGMAKCIPCILTLARLALTPLLCCFIIESRFPFAFAVFSVICVTDILDGFTARALGACTRFGSILDVIADLVYVMISLFVLNMKGLVPVWFMAVVVIKFLEFVVTSTILKRGRQNESAWVFDGLGRFSAALIFISPGGICFAKMVSGNVVFVLCFLLLICTFAVASTICRVIHSAAVIKGITSQREAQALCKSCKRIAKPEKLYVKEVSIS